MKITIEVDGEYSKQEATFYLNALAIPDELIKSIKFEK